MRKGIALVLALLFLLQTTCVVVGQESEETPKQCDLKFDGDLANQSVHFQTDLGPRIPGSSASSALRESIKSNLTGWHITESTHHSYGMTLTNLYATWNKGEGSTVILAAHYDTRHKAERDWNESRRDDPIDGANDGASGVAVLLEIARLIPQMNLTHEVMLFFTDGEDQGDDAETYTLGAKAWAENLSQEEADEIESFILVDMVGDAHLTLRKTLEGNLDLWNRTEEVILSIDEICGLVDSSYFDFDGFDLIIDDHVHAHNLGIPSIDIIDTRYGENAGFLQGHWHTHNDTDDKVSAESLQTVGYILEYGLMNGTWLSVRTTSVHAADSDADGVNDTEDKCPDTFGGNNDGCPPSKQTSGIASQDADELIIGAMLISCVILVLANFAWIIYAEKRGEG